MAIDTEDLTTALEGARAIVQADGGDLVLDRVDGSAVHLNLIIEGAECAECVMPRPFLEQIALDMVQAQIPDVAAISISDPRE
ncbi:MAG: NifU family protein [Acidimicrobiia bacterium]